MTDFTKTKISFALALLGTLFALHPFLEKFFDVGFDPIPGVEIELNLFTAFAIVGGLLALSVYCYAVALVSERPSSLLERLGNISYALAVLFLPLYGGLFLSHWLATQLHQPSLKWVAPTVAATCGVLWLALAWRLRFRLGEQDRLAKMRQLDEQEMSSLNRAREMFNHSHYDLAVIESWRAIEARLRRVLLTRRIATRTDRPEVMIALANRAGIVRDSTLEWLQELRRQWNIAVSTEPLTREAAEAALTAARNILATVAIAGPGVETPAAKKL
jgi:HEPN domain-containing protein